MRTTVAAALLIVATLACGSDSPTDPANRVLELGRYAFTTDYQPGTLGTMHDAGVITITAASPDEVQGHVAGNGPFSRTDPRPWTAPIDLGGWNLDAYVLYADAPDGIFVWRLARQGDGIACEGRFLRNESGGVRSYPTTCAVTYLGR